MPEIEYSVQGFPAAELKIRASGPKLKKDVQDLLQHAAQVALSEMQAKVPRGGLLSDNEDGTISESLEIMDRGVSGYHAGGAGGGGYYEVAVGPNPLTAPAHLRHVLRGTGIYGPTGNMIGPVSKKAMAFVAGSGRYLVRERVRGQRSNTEWLHDPREHARQIIALGIQQFDVRT